MSIYKNYLKKYNAAAKDSKIVLFDKNIWIVINYFEDNIIEPGNTEKVKYIIDKLAEEKEVEMLEAIKDFFEQLSK